MFIFRLENASSEMQKKSKLNHTIFWERQFTWEYWGLEETMTFTIAEPIFKIRYLNLSNTEPLFLYREIWYFEACFHF